MGVKPVEPLMGFGTLGLTGSGGGIVELEDGSAPCGPLPASEL